MEIKKARTKKQNDILRKEILKKIGAVLAARQHAYDRFTSNRHLVLSKSLDQVLSLLEQDDSSHKTIMLLAQTSKSIHCRVVRSEVYLQVQRRLQGLLMDIDAQLVLKQLEFSPNKPSSASGEGEADVVKRPSSIQIHVDFSALPVSAQSNALKGFKADYKDTIVNLGDALNAERLIFLGEGGFGSVFALPDERCAIKVFKRPARLEQVIRDVANEAACFHLASTLKRMSMSARGAANQNRFLPFTPLPSVKMAGSTSGAIALPSWGLGDGLYYPALIMDLAVGSINLESRELSKKFFSDPMGLVSEEGFIRLASLMRLVAEPLAAMHSLNVAHRDLKEDNILAVRVAPGVDGYIYYNTDGKKWTGRLADCGKALCFGVEFHVETDGTTTAAGGAGGKAASKRAKIAVEAISKLPVNKRPPPLALDEPLQPMAGMESKMGTVPKVIPVRAIHLLNPVAPSTDKKGDPTTIRRKAPLYSGTMTYTPPETIPPLPGGAEFLTARDYQAGDMWSVGVVLANVLGGSGLRISMLGSHDKTIFAQAEDRVIWTKLNKLSSALKEGGKVPDPWTDAMDLLRSLTRLDPQERMTASEVLQHPFLKKAEMLPRHYSS
jgi:serine/threonine protein kinase